jgi:hypothetical protein
MKKILLLFCFAISHQFLIAQCTPDTDATTWGLHPVPSVDLDGLGAVPETPAYIGSDYSYTFTVVIPSNLEVPAVGTIGVTQAVVTSIDGLPSGMIFDDCSSSNCIFPGGTTGCFNISGTPDASNTPGNFPITINVAISGMLGPLPSPPVEISFPPISSALNPFEFPLDPYAITLNFPVSNSNLLENELSVSENKPNPFSSTTLIDVDAEKSGDYTFTVTDLLGKEILKEEYSFATGKNTIEFDGANLSNGIYIYSLSSEAGSISNKMLISK